MKNKGGMVASTDMNKGEEREDYEYLAMKHTTTKQSIVYTSTYLLFDTCLDF